MSDGETSGNTADAGGARAEEPGGNTADTGSYGGVFGAYPYAFRASASRLFRSYVVLGGLVTVLIAALFAFAIVDAIAETAGSTGGTLTFVRTFVLLVGFLVVFPLVAPVILVARRHRRSESTVTYDRALAASGYLFVASLYLGVLPAIPPELREQPTGVLGPLIEAIYGLPSVAGFVPPLAAVAVGYLLHRRYR